jgi:hypothetical protein
VSSDEEASAKGTSRGVEKETAAQNPFLNALLPVLTAVGTGIGAIGFVIFFGGFIVWARFHAAGLPANEAVAQVPRNDLVVTGASFLVPALLAALAAVAMAVAAWEGFIGNRLRHRKAEARESQIRTDARIEMLRAEEKRAEDDVERLQGQMDRYRATAKDAEIDPESRKIALSNYRAARAKHQEGEQLLANLRESELPAARSDQADVARAAPEAEKLSRNEWRLQAATGVGPMILVELVVIGAGLGGLSWIYRGSLVLAMLVTVAIAIAVITRMKHFAWFALSVFLGVGAVIAFSTYVRTQSHPQVSPLAAIEGSAPVAGFFVAETSDAVYMGIPEPDLPNFKGDGDLEFDHSEVTLLRFPKASLASLTIGPDMDEGKAYKRALALALALCHRLRRSLPEHNPSPASFDPKGSPPGAENPRPCAVPATRSLRHRLALVKGLH